MAKVLNFNIPSLKLQYFVAFYSKLIAVMEKKQNMTFVSIECEAIIAISSQISASLARRDPVG